MKAGHHNNCKLPVRPLLEVIQANSKGEGVMEDQGNGEDADDEGEMMEPGDGVPGEGKGLDKKMSLSGKSRTQNFQPMKQWKFIF
eukprot:1773705-Karenia_brevis.AAC.1